MIRYKLVQQQIFFRGDEPINENNGKRKTITNIIDAKAIKFIGDSTIITEEIKNRLTEIGYEYEIGYTWHGPLMKISFILNNDEEDIYEICTDPYWKLYQIIDNNDILLIKHNCDYNRIDYKNEYEKNIIKNVT